MARQPRAWHTAVPMGTPATAATEKPAYTAEMARAVCSGEETSFAYSIATAVRVPDTSAATTRDGIQHRHAGSQHTQDIRTQKQKHQPHQQAESVHPSGQGREQRRSHRVAGGKYADQPPHGGQRYVQPRRNIRQDTHDHKFTGTQQQSPKRPAPAQPPVNDAFSSCAPYYVSYYVVRTQFCPETAEDRSPPFLSIFTVKYSPN